MAVLVAALLPVAWPAASPAGERDLARRANVTIDPATGTVRSVQARDRALTGVASGDRALVARRWVREHRAALGLTAGDVDGLALAGRTVTAATGITHVRYRQADRGIPAFGGGLRVSLDRGGRVLSATGAPVSGLEAGAVTPRLDAVAALEALQRDVGVQRPVDVVGGPSGVRRVTRFAGGDLARLVLFGRRLGWHLTYRATSAAHYDAVVDATSGEILFRQNLTKDAAPAVVYASHPGLAPIQVDLEQRGWLPPLAGVLDGPYARAYSDVDGNDAVSPGEEITRAPAGDFRFPLIEFGDCAPVVCTWDPLVPSSWRVNRSQNGVQAFYLVNVFREHLAAAPIGFAGFSGAEAVRVETNDSESADNASMATPPVGAPRMQLGRFAGDGFRDVNAGDSAAIVWHEYAHGLSSRLVTHADGSSALSTAHAGAMGEGWSDWYALDLLGQTDVGHYVDAVAHTVRTQAIDCRVGVVSAACPHGGYTLGDFGRIGDAAEVHADGEIWAQTLWDLRRAVGSFKARALITEGMRMAPPEPSFIDMRNAILAAEVGLAGDDRAAVWEVFRGRGMGYLAYAEDAGDATPAEDFSAPPAPGTPHGRTAGTVTSAESGLPLGNVAIGFAGMEAGARTGANGAYALDAPAGTYPELEFEAGGYEPVALPSFVVAAGGTRVQDAALRRDWAAAPGGAVVAAGSDNTGAPFGCGLGQLIDQRGDTTWSAYNNRPERPTAVIRLPAAVDVSAFGLNPTNSCGDPPGSSTAGYRIDVSGDGSSFATAVQSTFTAADRGRRTIVPAAAQGVRFVRLTLLSAQSPGSEFVDFSGLEVFGAPPNRLPSGALAASRVQLNPGGTVDFTASFSDPDSRITGYDWDFDGNGTVDRSTPGPSTSFAYRTAGTFDATVAVRDFRGGAGSATRRLVVTPLPRPRLELPRRGSHGRLTFRVTCVLRCRLTGTLKVERRTVRRLKRTIAPSTRRRVTVTLPRALQRAARRRGAKTVRAVLAVTARYADGRKATARRTVRIRL